jgi:hypothetical protein
MNVSPYFYSVLILVGLTGCAITPTDNSSKYESNRKVTLAEGIAGINIYHQHKDIPASQYDMQAYKHASSADKVRIAIDGKDLVSTSQSEHFTCVICDRNVNKTVDLAGIELSPGTHQITVYVNDHNILSTITTTLLREDPKGWKIYLQRDFEVQSGQARELKVLHSKRWKKAGSNEIFTKTFDGLEFDGTLHQLH